MSGSHGVDLHDRLLTALAPLVDGLQPVGAVVAAGTVDGPTTAACFGRTAVDGDTPTSSTLYRIGSITKTFTATAILALREAGRLSLDDPLPVHLPEAAKIDNAFGPVDDVTIGRLLTHRSGLMGEAPLDYWQTLQFPDRTQLLDALPAVRVAVEPGSVMKYSNLGYALLGEVVARVSGRSYRDYLETEVLAPLGLDDTRFVPDRERLATGYDRTRDGLRPAPLVELDALASAGQLYSTADDLLRWGAFHNGFDAGARSAVLSAAARQAMQHPAYLSPTWDAGTCLGWGAMRREGRVVLAHAGGIHGYSSMLIFVPDCRASLAVLVNDTLGSLEALALTALDVLLEATPATAPAAAPRPVVPAETAAALVGSYETDSLPSVITPTTIAVVDGGLCVQLASAGGAVVETALAVGPNPDELLVTEGRSVGEILRVLRQDGAVSGFALDGFHFRRVTG